MRLAAFVLGSRRVTIFPKILVTQLLSRNVCKYQKTPNFSSLRLPLLHSKAILLQVVIVFHNNAKKPWFKEWRIAFGRRRIFNTLTRQLIKKGIKCFKYQGGKEPSKTS